MRTIVLRFRDLNIPDGETLRRHREKIADYGCVWWGWIMRQRETFPEQYLSELAQELEKGSRQIFLFNSGEGRLYGAKLTDVVAYPGGERIQTPEVHKTPSYMAEAECPAWYQLREIDEHPTDNIKAQISSFPSLPEPTRVDLDLTESPLSDPDDFRLSTATIWEADVVGF